MILPFVWRHGVARNITRKPFRSKNRRASLSLLKQEFNSLDAQREAGEVFVKSQAHEGWRVLKTRPDTDDGVTLEVASNIFHLILLRGRFGRDSPRFAKGSFPCPPLVDRRSCSRLD